MFRAESKPPFCPECGSDSVEKFNVGMFAGNAEDSRRANRILERRARGDFEASAWECKQCGTRIYNSNDFSEEPQSPIIDPNSIDWERDIDMSACFSGNPPAIARNLVIVEQTIPGTVRMLANPRLLGTSCAMLKQVGIKKPFFKGPSQHIYDSVLS